MAKVRFLAHGRTWDVEVPKGTSLLAASKEIHAPEGDACGAANALAGTFSRRLHPSGMELGLPSHLRATASGLLAGGSGSVAIIGGVVFVQRLGLPLSVLWLGERDRAIAAVALFGAAALGFVRARASDHLARTVRLNLLELYLRPFERGPAPLLPSPEAVTSRLATALPVLVSWAVDGIAVVIAAAAAVPAVMLLLAHALGAPVLLPLGAAGLVGAGVTMATSPRVEAAWTRAWERSRALLTALSAGFSGAIDLRANGRSRA